MNDTEAEKYVDIARSIRNEHRARCEKLPESIKKQFSVESAEYSAKGELVIIISGIGYCHIVMTLTFSSGEKLRFEGNGGGIIAGAGGVAYGGAISSVSPQKLLEIKKMGFALHATPASTVLEFGGVGTFAGLGPQVATGFAFGEGSWTQS